MHYLFHDLKHSWKAFSGIFLSFVIAAILMESMSKKWVFFKTDLILGKRKKSHRARLGEYVLANSKSSLFWYSERIFGTIFTHNLQICKLSVRIYHIVSLPMESSSKIILTVSQQSTHTSCFT